MNEANVAQGERDEGDECHTLDDLLRAAAYLLPGDLAIVRDAYHFAADAHAGQTRRSGELYIAHPLASALTLANLRLDAPCLAAALLHDVPEDGEMPISAIEARFGEEIARLVTGVTRLTRLVRPAMPDAGAPAREREEEDEAWATNLRRMFLAMADDVRVILIKLADRLHNMQTLRGMPPATRPHIAQETLDIYAPLAGRLGILRLRRRLEDLAFQHLEPVKYSELAALVEGQHKAREENVNAAIALLREHLTAAGIDARFSGRVKHLYGIYRKLVKRGIGFGELFDITAVRVIVPEIADCYRALGVVHALWPPIPGQFDDYIAMPKENRYQSLHTAVVGPAGKPIEIQIRTLEMHRVAEYGVAAHWRYKEGGKPDPKVEQNVAWLRQLLDRQSEEVGDRDFVDSLRTDVFRDQVHVFTPKGEVVTLAAGATPIDFAYRIHTDIGHRCVGAIVNQRLVSLDYQLQNGDIVEIATSKNAEPSPDWLKPSLNYVKTANARSKIRQWFRRQHGEDNIARGRQQLEAEIAMLGLPESAIDTAQALFDYPRAEDLLAAIGCGELRPETVAARLMLSLPATLPPAEEVSKGVRVVGHDDLPVILARCCDPVPGEPIIGYLTPHKVTRVHRTDCPRLLAAGREHLLEVAWTGVDASLYAVDLLIEAFDRPGLVRDVASVVADDHINMSTVSVKTHADRTATISATLMVRDLDQLSRIVARLEGVRGVSLVRRDVV